MTMDSSSTTEYITPTTPALSTAGDTLCGVLCILILVLGLLGNIPAIIHFGTDLSNKIYLNEKKLCFDSLFVCISVTDTLICLGMFPIILSFLEARNPEIFKNVIFCKIWGVSWTILPYFSIFLVATLSFTRTYTLVSPLRAVKSKLVLGVVGLYLLFLVLRSGVPLLVSPHSGSTYNYFHDSVLCQEEVLMINSYWHFKMVANQVQLLMPMFPVTISAVVSFVVLQTKRRRLQCSERVARMQSEATTTIMMVTILYWLCNFPVVVNYMYYHIMSRRHYTYREMYGSVFMHWYSWPATLTLSVGINSVLNPLVYLTRMKRFREFFIKGYQRFADNFSVTVRPSTNTINLSSSGIMRIRLSDKKNGADHKYKPATDDDVVVQ